MINKKELVLFCALMFCLGFIVSDFTKPAYVKADVTNIVAETLDAKISKEQILDLHLCLFPLAYLQDTCRDSNKHLGRDIIRDTCAFVFENFGGILFP